VDTFLDERDVGIGEDIPERLYREITRASHFLYFISKTSVSSQWVQEEFSIAKMCEKESQGTIVLPILIDEVEPPIGVKSKRYADFRSRRVSVRSREFGLVLKALSLTAKAGDHIYFDEEVVVTCLECADAQVGLSDLNFLFLFAANAGDEDLTWQRIRNAGDEIRERQICERLENLSSNLTKYKKLSYAETLYRDIDKHTKALVINVYINTNPNRTELPPADVLEKVAEEARYLVRRFAQLQCFLLAQMQIYQRETDRKGKTLAH